MAARCRLGLQVAWYALGWQWAAIRECRNRFAQRWDEDRSLQAPIFSVRGSFGVLHSIGECRSKDAQRVDDVFSSDSDVQLAWQASKSCNQWVRKGKDV